MDMQISLRQELDIFTRRSKALAEAAWIDASRVIDLIARDGLEVCYQPKMSSIDLQCVGFEAQVRLKGTRSRSEATNFLGCLERAGIVSAIDVWVCEEVEKAIGRWASQELYPLVSVNLHPDTIACGPALDDVVKALRYLNVEIEIGESASLARDSMLNGVCRLRQGGIRITIDDFGMGYANYRRLAGVHFDSVKMDKSLIAAAMTPRGRLILGSACDLCRKLGLNVIAEGIDTREHLDLARSLSIDFLQGWYFASPLCWDEASEFFVMNRSRVSP
jgi:EAL domain-containing protein (putative c-di-GMP-specific phosphodiesterase class I)